jgi:hypothetical protein
MQMEDLPHFELLLNILEVFEIDERMVSAFSTTREKKARNRKATKMISDREIDHKINYWDFI